MSVGAFVAAMPAFMCSKEFNAKRSHVMIDRIDIYLYTYLEINRSDFIGARMFLYLPETTDPVNIYDNSKGDFAIMNPVVFDCEGRPPKVFVNKPYRVVIEDSRGARIFEDYYD